LRHVLRVPCTEEMGLVERYKDLVDVVVFAAREEVVDGDRDIHGEIFKPPCAVASLCLVFNNNSNKYYIISYQYNRNRPFL
jgi:hypothetical protein